MKKVVKLDGKYVSTKIPVIIKDKVIRYDWICNHDTSIEYAVEFNEDELKIFIEQFKDTTTEVEVEEYEETI